MTRPTLGDTLTINARAYKTHQSDDLDREYPKKTVWVSEPCTTVQATFVGYRTAYDGITYGFEQDHEEDEGRNPFSITSTQEVWLVVSDPRRKPFFVFPSDTDFQPKGPAVTQTPPQLTPLSDQELRDLVIPRLDELTAQNATFTSWMDVVLPLRQQNPDKLILTADVRGVVHDDMYDRIINGLSYSAEVRDYDQPDGSVTQAATYFPVDESNADDVDAIIIAPRTADGKTVDWDALLDG